MAPPKRISRVAVKSMLMEGRRDSEIAHVLGTERTVIGKIRRAMGITPPKIAARQGDKWNKSEDTELIELFLDGEKISDIAAAMNRGFGSIKRRLKILDLAGKSPYLSRGSSDHKEGPIKNRLWDSVS